MQMGRDNGYMSPTLSTKLSSDVFEILKGDSVTPVQPLRNKIVLYNSSMDSETNALCYPFVFVVHAACSMLH